MTLRRLSAPLAALLVALGLVASGCGGSQVAIPELTSLTQAAKASASSNAAQFAMTIELKLPGADETLSFSAEGGFDTLSRRSRVSVDLSSFAELTKQFGSVLGGSATGDLGDSDDWKLDAIMDGDVVYVRFPLIAEQLPDGKTWVKGDAKEFSDADATGLDQFSSLAGIDPRDVFGLLEAVSGSIETVGSEEIRGVSTNHYRATLDPAKLTALLPAEQQASLGGIDEAARQAGLTALPLDIWVDADDRVRKISIALDTEIPGIGGSLEASFVIELYDYGTPLELELPPADQVADAATLKSKTS